MEQTKKRRFLGMRIFWGLFFLAAGGTVILNLLGLLEGINLFSLLLCIILLAIFIQSLYHLNWFGVFIPLAVAAGIFAEPLGISDTVSLVPLLVAAVLLSVGFSILFKGHGRFIPYVGIHGHNHRGYYGGRRINKDSGNDENGGGDGDSCESYSDDNKYDKVVSSNEGEVVYANTSFGTKVRYINSKILHRAVLDCSFGDMKVYFDNARISGDSAEIQVNVSFGNLDVYIPDSWTLIDAMDITMGAATERNPERARQGNVKVTLIGDVTFGNLSIFYV
jgi:hypothetical protein